MVSIYYTKVKTINYHQKHAARIKFNENILRPLLRSLSALN